MLTPRIMKRTIRTFDGHLLWTGGVANGYAAAKHGVAKLDYLHSLVNEARIDPRKEALHSDRRLPEHGSGGRAVGNVKQSGGEPMNTVHLIGRVATDVEIKEVAGGSKVSSFILAVDRNAEEADFFRIKAWNSLAEAAGDHLSKGRRIAVEGSLRQDVYEKDREERKLVSVVAMRIEYL